MAFRIEIKIKDEMSDALGARVASRIRDDLDLVVEYVRTVSVYTVDADVSLDDVKKLAQGPYCDPVIQTPYVENSAGMDMDFDWLIEVGFRPGVTDNAGRTAKEAAQVRLGKKFPPGQGVYTSTQYLIKGDLNLEQVENIAKGALANELIQRWSIFNKESFYKNRGVEAYVPKVTGVDKPTVTSYDLDVSDEELIKLSKANTWALSLNELLVIRDYFNRDSIKTKRTSLGLTANPTDVEIETLAQTWSEHCKHKIFNSKISYTENGETEIIDSIFKTYVVGATEKIRINKGDKDFCLSVFVDNAGVIRFNDKWSLVMKCETHNSPSALDPYGGALTGIVGVNRDPFGTGKGAKLIFNVDTFCFAPPNWSKPLPPRLLHPKRVFEGVREGVEHGGNKSGIPTIDGGLVFDDRYAGKPLVYCGTGGIMPAEICGEPSEEKGARPGDLAIMCGGRIGKDGIHGATFSSEQLHKGSPATAVQIGDPITQKRMTDFLLIARDKCLYSGITDNGAGGLSSSIGETAENSGGCVVNLDKAPVKYPGLDPWEILLSEAQERMTLSVPLETLDEFMSLAKKMNVEASILGEYTDSGDFHIKYDGKTVACLDMEFLHNGNPQLELSAAWEKKKFKEPDTPDNETLNDPLKSMLARLNVCSKEYVIRQYDHEVQAGSVVKPLVGKESDGPSDAAVWRPLLDSMEAVVVSNGICPKYSDIDTYHMMAGAIDEAVRNAVAVGGDVDYMAGLDNFCWCDPVKSDDTPDGEYKLAQLVRACRALYDVTTTYGVPCISGKDSMKNDYKIGDHKISIPPTVLFTVIGKMEDATKAVTMDFKSAGDKVYALGITYDEMGGSEYFSHFNKVGNSAPKVRPKTNLTLYRKLRAAIKNNLVKSCHDCSDGGIGVAIAESAFSGGLGVFVDGKKIPSKGITRNDHLLFSESHGRFVVSVKPEKAKEFEDALKGVEMALIGQVTEDNNVCVKGLDDREIINSNIDNLKKSWKATLDF